MTRSATASLMHSINRGAVLDLIRQSGPIARSQIARRLNMSLPTVMRIVDSLIDEDLVHNPGTFESTKGRPRALVEFNGDGYAVVGVDLGGTKMFGAVADLAGNIQHEVYMAHDRGDAGRALDSLSELIGDLLQVPRPAGQRIRGIGIGATGLTLSPQGIVTWAPSLGWRDVPLKDILSDRFGVPVFVENDVNLAALGEWGFGAGRGTHNLVCMTVGTGIGLGIIIGGTLYRGHHQAAGEIGYLPPGVEYLGRVYGQFGPLESLASGTGVAERARAALGREGLPIPEDGITAEDVFAAAREGRAWAERVVNETVDYLSLAIAAISSLLDPEVIVLGGGVARSADLLIEPILQRVRGVTPFTPRLVPSALGYRAAVMGAIMLVLNGTTESFVISRPS